MKNLTRLPLLVLVLLAACEVPPPLEPESSSTSGAALTSADIDATLAFAQQQLLKTETRLGNTAHPRSTSTDFKGGQWATTNNQDWRAGFFTGSEWLMYENYGDNTNGWKAKADGRTRDFSAEVSRTQTHDVGFKTLMTYGNGFRLTNLEEFRPKIFAGANTLAARFLPQYGVTQSWGTTVGSGDIRVIIDNMMNIEVLFLAAELTTNAADRDRWLSMAVSHARKTEQNHVRDSADPTVDGSTCHVYYYNLGVCRTHQGLSDSSTWARGQTWAMYGFTMAYEYSRKYPQYVEDAALFLATAQRTSDLYLRRLAEPKHVDMVPLHDFDAAAGSPKDSSAAAVAASALLELSRLAEVPATKRQEYKLAAERTLDDLRRNSGTKPYRETSTATDTAKETVLLRATTTYKGPGDSANADVERGLSYADHYFIEALLRHKDMYGSTPRPPTFLAATGTTTSTTLSWRATRGADSYTIKRRPTATGTLVTLGTSLTPSYTDNTVTAGSTYFYVVTATNLAGIESASSNQVSRTVVDPATLTGVDVGAVAAAGSTSVSNNVYTVKGSGADIWSTADAFQFAQKQMTGNVTIIARVASHQNTNATSKAGIMVRESLAPGAKNVYALLTPTVANGYRLQYRTADAAITTRVSAAETGTAPRWLRLSRAGNTFTAHHSADGVSNWLPIGSPVTVTMGATVYVGLAVTSHADGTLNTSTFDNVTITP
jgi:unsaturated chondroitin disaccharide hydrolase